MKKLLVLFLLMFLNPLFASGIDANATDASCDNTTLETYSGTANVEINWVPNTIQTRWYDGNTLIDTTNTNAASCEYDDVLNVPPTPTARTGYTFTGWTVRPEMDFSTLNTDGTVLARYGKDNYNWCGYTENGEKKGEGFCTNFPNVTEFNDLSTHESKVIFEHGTLYFMGKCSAKSGNNDGWQFDNNKSNWATTSAELEISGEQKYCWCRATGYKPNNQDTIYGPSKQLDFVFFRTDTADHCQYTCAMSCGYYISQYWYRPNVRTAVLGTY